ncbi:ribonuclease P protein component [Glaciibacter superstes]|uniref:ribonuclease P protein component n=1 Tax=Glaciibacter superstes TaxID=501023 RepID=UPI0003B3B823|nr:ribonuclease P protein component [Glaciibacter superstes]
MLAKANRLASGSDYKATVRRGKRVIGKNTVTYIRTDVVDTPARFGFIVAKNVGGAVVRNRIRRRLKAASFTQVSGIGPGASIVIRALPSSTGATFSVLAGEVADAVGTVRTRR